MSLCHNVAEQSDGTIDYFHLKAETRALKEVLGLMKAIMTKKDKAKKKITSFWLQIIGKMTRPPGISFFFIYSGFRTLSRKAKAVKFMSYLQKY